MDTKTIILIIVIIMAIDFMFGFKIYNTISKRFEKSIENRIRSDRAKTYTRIKYSKIVAPKKNILTKYLMFVETIIIDLKLGINVDNFNTLLIIMVGGLSAVYYKITGDLILSILLAVATIVVLVSFLVQVSRVAVKQKVDKVMEAEDLICPLINNGVVNAIEKALPSIDESIRPYFERFLVQHKVQGYTIYEALDNLKYSLGNTSNGFIEKAKIFEYGERDGMVSIFMDVVDNNAIRREINAEKDYAFRTINRNLMYKITIVGVFGAYVMTDDSVRNFLLVHDLGKLVLSLVIIMFAVIYALNQKIQSDIKVE